MIGPQTWDIWKNLISPILIDTVLQCESQYLKNHKLLTTYTISQTANSLNTEVTHKRWVAGPKNGTGRKFKESDKAISPSSAQ